MSTRVAYSRIPTPQIVGAAHGVGTDGVGNDQGGHGARQPPDGPLRQIKQRKGLGKAIIATARK